VHTGFWWENLKGRDHLKDLGIDERVILKLIFEKCNGARNGSIWFRIGTCGGLL
jgi:hypothetical protein